MSDQVDDQPIDTQPSGPSGGEAPGATRRKRLTRLAAAAATAGLTIAVILLTTGASNSAPSPRGRQAIDQQIKTLLAGIPQSGNTLGDVSAPVTLQWFGDLECPFCKEFTLGALPSIIRGWVRSGVLAIEYRSMETATRDPAVFKLQQTAALAAGMQNEMWYFLEAFYHEQGEEDSGYVTETYLQGLAKQVPGLNLPEWTEDRNSTQLATEVATDLGVVQYAHFRGTPSFLIGATGAVPRELATSSLTKPAEFNRAIEVVLHG